MITARTLLYKALDFDGFWNSSKKMRDTEPSKARKLQLDSLLLAFQISKKDATSSTQVPTRNTDKNVITRMLYSSSKYKEALDRPAYIKTLTDFQYFKSGEFIADRDEIKYHHTLTHISATIKNIFPNEVTKIFENEMNQVRLFNDLYAFRHMAYVTFESSFLHLLQQNAAVEGQYFQHLKQNVINKIPASFSEIDDLLCLLIDPEKRSFTEADISYPVFDLAAIDLNWQKNQLNKVLTQSSRKKL